MLKGVRYIVEGQPVGTATQPAFVSSLKMLGEKNLLFEFCINTTEQGMTVLDEVLECITQVRDGQAEGERTSFVIDHLAKPDLKGAVDSPMYTRGKGFADFTARIFEFALLPEVVIKCVRSSPNKKAMAEQEAQTLRSTELRRAGDRASCFRQLAQAST